MIMNVLYLYPDSIQRSVQQLGCFIVITNVHYIFVGFQLTKNEKICVNMIFVKYLFASANFRFDKAHMPRLEGCSLRVKMGEKENLILFSPFFHILFYEQFYPGMWKFFSWTTYLIWSDNIFSVFHLKEYIIKVNTPERKKSENQKIENANYLADIYRRVANLGVGHEVNEIN